MADTHNTLQGRYESLKTTRDLYEERAKEMSKYTIPFLFPDEINNEATSYQTPWQSIGAQGITHLTSKIIISQFPPSTPFFRFKVSERELEIQEQPELMSQIEKELSSVERTIMDEFSKASFRTAMIQAMEQLLVSGNVLLHMMKNGQVKVFPLTKFTLMRNPEGEIIEIITHEETYVRALSEDLRVKAGLNLPSDEEDGTKMATTGIYTRLCLKNSRWEMTQEINKIIVNSGSYKKDESPWIPLTSFLMPQEHYGRSYIERLIGDLKSLEGSMKTVIESSAISGKVVFIKDPSSTIQTEDLVKAQNGDIVDGDPNSVVALQVQKQADLSVLYQTIAVLNDRLAKAFLLREAAQRDAERVTATEFKAMVEELESTLGGLYSTLAEELQKKLVAVQLKRLRDKKKIPVELLGLIKDGTISLEIITGLEALGRGNDLQRLETFISIINQNLGPEAVLERLNVDDYMTRLGASLSISTDGLVKTKEELEAERQQAHAMAMEQQTAGPMVQRGTELAKQQLQQNQQPQG